MKTIKTMITLCLIITAPVLLSAQDIDNTRMDRDLRIMENILVEMFIPKPQPNMPVRVSPIGRIDGQYLPGYGVYFTIPARVNIRPFNVRRLGNDDEGVIQAEAESVTDLISEAEVRSLATEFLKNYAPTISQLQPDNKITIIYGVRGNRFTPGNVYVRSLQGSIQNTNSRIISNITGQSEQPAQKIVTVTATKKNLDDFRAGRMNDSRFESALTVSVSDINDRKQDLDLFKTILESAHRQQEEVVFRMSGPDYIYFDHLGVIFQSTLNISPLMIVPGVVIGGRGVGGGNNRSELEAARSELEATFNDAGVLLRSLEVQVNMLDSIRVNLPDSVTFKFNIPDSVTFVRPPIYNQRIQIDSTYISQQVAETVQRLRGEAVQREKERKEALEALDLPKALNTSISTLKEVLIDYGRTLSSVNSDQHILISLNVVARNVEGVPTRVDLQIKKSDLEEMERGRITRDQALSRIIERRF